MVSSLTGTVISQSDKAITFRVGPIGLEIQVPNSALLPLNAETTLCMYMHWHQENGPSFYGFTSELEKSVFLLIISCSGIGPKIGLAVLADLGAERFLEAVQTGSHTTLNKVNGIGTKKAEQMVVQLKHKVASIIKSGVNLGAAQHIAHWQTVAEALESLKYSRAEINNAMGQLQQNYTGSESSFDQLLRQALAFLTK